MSWSVPPQAHRIYARNPLVAVVVELRFFPILQVPQRIADFQDHVRSTFPGYQDLTRSVVTMGPMAPVDVREEKLFSFNKADGTTTLSLTTTALTVECRRHQTRDTFIEDTKVGVDSLSRTYGGVVPARLGLRYVDIIDRRVIENDLGRTCTWSALIAEKFLRVPSELADLDRTLFACEVASPMMAGGGMTVRHGLVQDSDGTTKFRLDVDRYLDGPIEVDAIVGQLATFADDIFAVFVQCMGPELEAWMSDRRS